MFRSLHPIEVVGITTKKKKKSPIKNISSACYLVSTDYNVLEASKTFLVTYLYFTRERLIQNTNLLSAFTHKMRYENE